MTWGPTGFSLLAFELFPDSAAREDGELSLGGVTRVAGSDDSLRTASSSVSTLRLRTNSAITRGKFPYERGCGRPRGRNRRASNDHRERAVQRLPDGNTLLTEAGKKPRILEIDAGEPQPGRIGAVPCVLRGRPR